MGACLNREKRKRMRKFWKIVSALWLLFPFFVFGESRFPQPQFDSGHTVPQAVNPAFAERVPPWGDVLILALALGIAAWLVRRVRSRRWILLFSLICLGWFGFVRQGCICPVGSTQNVAAAAWAGGGLPWFVAALFALPLVAALFFGRVFCAAVCPLGALQDLFIVWPKRVPRALDTVLRLVPLIVLSVGVVCAVNGAGYLICRTDPFVGFFRHSAPLSMLLIGMAVLLVGMVVARPYCRYFCPYGVLLEGCSRLAWKGTQVTRETCINCRLCAAVCPVDAVAAPRETLGDRARSHQFGRFLRVLALAPVIVAGCAGTGWLAGAGVARLHPDVALVEVLATATAANEDLHPEIEAFKRLGKERAWAETRAVETTDRFRTGCAGAGAFVGLVIVLRLLGLTQLQRRQTHEADRVRCIACGRCFAACPKNHAAQTRTSESAATT
jgi:ferredoxin